MLAADDLQVFLAVARTGRLVRAAEQLGVDHTTVGRRINALERASGHRLFDRTPSGWVLTLSGQRLLDPAEAMAVALQHAHEALGNRGSSLRGNVRILTPDGFGAFILAPEFGTLREKHPDLTVELVTATAQLDHSVGSFDVAVTLGKPASDRLLIRPLTDYIIRLYASREYLRRHGPIEHVEDLGRHPLIWYVDRLLDLNRLRDIPKELPGKVMVQSTNLIAHWQAAGNGVGVAPMPQFVAQQDSRLVHILPELEFSAGYWLVLPKEHARLPRVRAVASLIERAAENHTNLLSGAPDSTNAPD